MRFSSAASSLLAVSSIVSAASFVTKRKDNVTVVHEQHITYSCEKIKPKVFIISMFSPEADVWYENMMTEGSIGNLFARNITVPGFSTLFPDVHCVADGSVCQLTTGESEINAALTVGSLLLSPAFDLTSTYFLVAGIAGINPKEGTIGDIAFSKYAIQVALQYEFDAREMPSNWTTGYWALGTYAPGEYPINIYGTEVYEVNEALRDMAADFAMTASPFTDSDEAVAYRANYAPSEANRNTQLYVAGTHAPTVIKCDAATSDVYYSGHLMGEAFENTTKLLTNGSGSYCMTAQEDNATLEAMLRGAVNGLVDFSRMIIMRTGSDFDRPYHGITAEFNLLYSNEGAFGPAIANIYNAGVKVVQGILTEWDTTFEAGVKPTNYIGDIFGSLGGVPDFGPGSITGGEEVVLADVPITRRSSYKQSASRRTAKGALGFKRAQAAQRQ